MATDRCTTGIRRLHPIPLSGVAAELREVDARDPAARLACFLILGAACPSEGFDGVRFSTDPDSDFDALIIADPVGAAGAPALLRRTGSWLTPVADLSGARLWFADTVCEDATAASWRRAVDRSVHVLHALAALPDVVLDADDDDTRLLARVHSRARGLQPVHDPSSPRLVRYPAAGLLEEPERMAERLVECGWLARTFFDRMHVCPDCASSRLNVREECPACGSAQLSDESILHHFRCAHQGIERDFAHGDTLTCPKCRRRLRHFGVDYDRPGSMTVCSACGHIDNDADVVFVCLDCGHRASASMVETRDWHAYSMTAAGEQRLLGGDLRNLRVVASETSTFHTLAEHWMRMRDRYGRPSAVVRLTFARAAEVSAEFGPRALAMARRQAIEIVRGELRDTDFTVEAADGLLIVMPETDAGSVDVPRRRIASRLAATLAVDLGIEIVSIDANDLFRRSAGAA